MSNSPLVVYTKLSPNFTKGRKHAIDTITIHCMAGNLSIETCGNVFAPAERRASSNYGIGSDGRVGLYVNEADRSWCTSSSANDNRAITIEVANTEAKHPWPVSDKALVALINLCTDICQRNGIKALVWRPDKNNPGNMTVHRWYANKACPGDYLYERHGYIAAAVNKQLGTAPAPQPTPAPTTDSEAAIWAYLKGQGLNDCAAAGLMGNLYAESALKPTNMQNSYESKLGMNDATYTAAVDNGSYPNFVRDGVGYGLAQWTFWSRKENLYQYARQSGKSIGDLQIQLEFLWRELQGYSGVMRVLNTAASVRQASDVVLLQFERPADQSEAVQVKRAGYGQKYYDKFAGQPAPGVDTPPSNATFKTGDTVQFIGGAVYTSSNAATPARSRGESVCNVTKTYNGKHPYHLISTDGRGVWGWVDASTVKALGSAAPFTPYTVKITGNPLNIRKGPGTNYDTNGAITDNGVYTIVEEADGAGAKKWGRLKSGAGWISLDYTKKL